MKVLASVWQWLTDRSRDRPDTAADAERITQAEQDAGPPPSPERRRLLRRVGLGMAGVAAALGAIPMFGVLFSPVLRTDPQVWRRVGRVEEFPAGETVKVSFLDPEPLPWAGFAARTAAWVRREGDERFVAFSLYCTHTGCPVAWAPGAKLFLCPCHGGAFYPDGSVASGPPPRPLERIQLRVREGYLEIVASPAPLPDDSGGGRASGRFGS